MIAFFTGLAAGALHVFSGVDHLAALEHGVLLRPIGNTVYFMPPYVVDDNDVEHMLDGARRALGTVLT